MTGQHHFTRLLPPSAPDRISNSNLPVRDKIKAYVEWVAGSDGKVWYYAYGSNMNSKVLTGRRKVVPLESIPVVSEGWVMRYAARGACYVSCSY